jgi:hypothetical protein
VGAASLQVRVTVSINLVIMIAGTSEVIEVAPCRWRGRGGLGHALGAMGATRVR